MDCSFLAHLCANSYLSFCFLSMTTEGQLFVCWVITDMWSVFVLPMLDSRSFFYRPTTPSSRGHSVNQCEGCMINELHLTQLTHFIIALSVKICQVCRGGLKLPITGSSCQLYWHRMFFWFQAVRRQPSPTPSSLPGSPMPSRRPARKVRWAAVAVTRRSRASTTRRKAGSGEDARLIFTTVWASQRSS